jgi:hypothetical protein
MLLVETWLTVSIGAILVSLFIASASPAEELRRRVGRWTMSQTDVYTLAGAALFVIGLYGLITRPHLLHKILALNISSGGSLPRARRYRSPRPRPRAGPFAARDGAHRHRGDGELDCVCPRARQAHLLRDRGCCARCRR